MVARNRKSKRRIVPIETVPHCDYVASDAATRERISCPACAKTFCGSATQNEGPMRCAGYVQIHRYAYCDHCGHIWQWWQSCDEQGRPTEHMVSDPHVITDPVVIERMLTNYPHLLGVEDSSNAA